jgi:Zn-finger in ubiquitin-hydrolases and other protein
MTPGSYDMAVSMDDVGPNGSAPHCEHVDLLVPVVPQPARCTECHARGMAWPRLMVCLTCGWVACSDDSPHRHARAHYEETDHPLAAEFAPEPGRRWCYVHRRAV